MLRMSGSTMNFTTGRRDDDSSAPEPAEGRIAAASPSALWTDLRNNIAALRTRRHGDPVAVRELADEMDVQARQLEPYVAFAIGPSSSGAFDAVAVVTPGRRSAASNEDVATPEPSLSLTEPSAVTTNEMPTTPVKSNTSDILLPPICSSEEDVDNYDEEVFFANTRSWSLGSLELLSFFDDAAGESLTDNTSKRMVTPDNGPEPGTTQAQAEVFDKNFFPILSPPCQRNKEEKFDEDRNVPAKKKTKRHGKAKAGERIVRGTNLSFEQYIRQDGIDGDLICLCGKGSHNLYHGGNKGFQAFAAPFLDDYNSKTSRKERERFANEVRDAYYEEGRRFFWAVADEWEDMPKNEARKKIGQFFRDLNNPNKTHQAR